MKCIFKIITKIIASRLRVHLEILIHPCQSSFIPQRVVTDNVIINHEIMRYLKGVKGKKGYMSIKFDLKKTYG